jgi:hypothetical protein
VIEGGEVFCGSNYLVNGVGGFSRAILKFSTITICEVFGYQIASLVGVCVPRAQGFYAREAIKVRALDSDPGRIGILVDFFSDWRDLSWEDAKRLDCLTVARAVAFEVFNRDEWGHFGLSGGQVYFIDHERVLPHMQPEALIPLSAEERIESLRLAGDWYNEQDFGRINDVFAEAEEQDVVCEVEDILRGLAALQPDSYAQVLSIGGHPLQELLSGFAAASFGRRVNAIAETLGLPTHLVPDWC